MVKRLSTLLALVAGLLLPAAGGHAAEGDWVYLRKGADGNFEERTLPLVPNTFLSVGGNGTLLTQSAGNFTAALGLSTVAATGNYSDLTNTPALFSGSWNDLADKPTLFSGSYSDLTNKPTLFSGNYSDLSGTPDLTGKANLSGSTFTGKVNTVASTATSAGFSIAPGTTPASPQTGDLWMTTGGVLQVRAGAASRSFSYSNAANTYAVGATQSVTHNSTTAGLRVTPAAGDPSTLTDGDLWHNSTTFKLRARINNSTESLATEAWAGNRSHHTGTQGSGTITTAGTSLLLGRVSAGAGAVEELTASQAQSLLGLGTMATRNATEFLALGASQPAWALTPFSGNATIASNQSGIGWDELGRFNIQTPVGAFQIYNTGNPSVPTLYWPGKIVSQSFDAIYVNGFVYASQIVGGQAGGNIAPSLMVSSMPEVLSNWIGLQSSAEQAGIPYDVDPDAPTNPEVPAYEPRAGDWFPIARTSVQAGGTNSLEGKYLSPAQARESLGITLAIQAGCSSFNPVQGNATTGIGSTYTFSQVFDLAPAAQRRMGFPIPLKLAAATLTVTVGGTLAAGASGPATLHLVNHTTGASTQILGGIVFTSQNWIGKSTGLSVALNATDDYSLRLDTPYFATPPTAVRLQATLYLMP